MTFGRHHNDFCCCLSDVKVRDEFRPKFKIPHSYDHLVSTSGQCDASIKGYNLEIRKGIYFIIDFIPYASNVCSECLNVVKIYHD